MQYLKLFLNVIFFTQCACGVLALNVNIVSLIKAHNVSELEKLLAEKQLDPSGAILVEEQPAGWKITKTPLFIAVEAQKPDIVKLLLLSGAHADEGYRKENGSDRVSISPLYKAVSSNKIEIVKVLIEQGKALPNKGFESKEIFYSTEINPLITTTRSPLFMAVEGRNLSMVTYLLGHGADVTRGLSRDGDYIKKGFSSEIFQRTFTSPLYAAVDQGDLSLVKALVEQGRAPLDKGMWIENKTGPYEPFFVKEATSPLQRARELKKDALVAYLTQVKKSQGVQ